MLTSKISLLSSSKGEGTANPSLRFNTLQPYDLIIATTSYFGPYGTCDDGSYRLRLFLDEVDSMAATDFAGWRVKWLVHDDASPIQKFPSIPASIDCEVIRHTERLTNSGRIPIAITHAASFAPAWIMSLDSDGLVSRNCFPRLRSMISLYPDQSVFGTFNTKYHPTLEERDGHVLKRSLCEHSIVFRSELWRTPALDFGLLANIRHSAHRPYPCLSPSGVQHTGKAGLNGTMDDEDGAFILYDEGVKQSTAIPTNA